MTPEATPVAQDAANRALDMVQAAAVKAEPLIDATVQQLLKFVQEGSQFAQDQIPQVAHEIIYWGIANAALYVGVGLILGLVSYLSYRHAKKTWEGVSLSYDTSGYQYDDSKRDRMDEEDMIKKPNGKPYYSGDQFFTICAAILSVVSGVIGFFITLSNVFDMVKPIVAPRLYLIEYLTELAKKVH